LFAASAAVLAAPQRPSLEPQRTTTLSCGLPKIEGGEAPKGAIDPKCDIGPVVAMRDTLTSRLIVQARRMSHHCAAQGT
jgi:hypothetical protein